jgi:hypothetical protein
VEGDWSVAEKVEEKEEEDEQFLPTISSIGYCVSLAKPSLASTIGLSGSRGLVLLSVKQRQQMKVRRSVSTE